MNRVTSFFRLTRQEVLLLTIGFLAWRFALFFIGFLAPSWLAYQPSFPYADSLLPSFGLPQWLYSWANFDGVHYLTIVNKSYFGTGLIQAFFPGYPLLVWVLNVVIKNTIISALVISNLATYGLWLVWYSWLKMEVSAKAAWIGTAILFLFPTSFFFGAVYGESIFLGLVITSFMAGRRGHWWLAGCLAAAASASRIVGIMLVPALLVELAQQIRDSRAQRLSLATVFQLLLTQYLSSVAWIMVGVLGLLGYMTYLQLVFHDALFFLHVQAEFGAGRQESIVVYPQVVWRYIKILMTYLPHDLKFIALVQEALAGTLGLVLIGLSTTKVRWSYWLFSLGVFLVPTFTGTFSSMPRYVLPTLAIWLVLTMGLSRVKAWVLVAYLLCSASLLIYNLVLFIQGYWVA